MSDHLKRLAAIRNGFVKKEEKPKSGKPASQSEKRKVDQRAYRKIVAEMMKESNECEIKEEGCQFFATGLHHQKKRSPATFLDRKFLKRSCDSCNAWCELHPLEAIEKGHSISKHKKLTAELDKVK